MIEYMKQIINVPHPIYMYIYIEIFAEQSSKYLQSIMRERLLI